MRLYLGLIRCRLEPKFIYLVRTPVIGNTINREVRLDERVIFQFLPSVIELLLSTEIQKILFTLCVK